MLYIGPIKIPSSSSKVRVGDRKKARRDVREMEKNGNANQREKRGRKED